MPRKSAFGKALEAKLERLKVSKKKVTSAQISKLFREYNKLQSSAVYGEFVHPLRPKMKPMKPIRALDPKKVPKLKMILRKLRALEKKRKSM